MLNLIEAKGNKMLGTPSQLFNNLSNEDLITIAEAGELGSFCKALTLDLVTYNKEVETYKA